MTDLLNSAPPTGKADSCAKPQNKQRAERLRLTQQAVRHVLWFMAKEDVPALAAWEIIWHGIYWELQRRRSIYVNTGQWDFESTRQRSARLRRGVRK